MAATGDKMAATGDKMAATGDKMAATGAPHASHSDNYLAAHAWIQDVVSTTSGMTQLVFITCVLAFITEAVGALYQRTRERPLRVMNNMTVCLLLHNLLSSLLYGLKLGLMLLLMIIWMELEPLLCTAVVVGAVVGHLSCHWLFMWRSENYQQYDLQPLTRK